MTRGATERTDLDVAIIGLSGRFPGARTVDEFWENLRAGVESICFFDDEELLAAGVDPELLSDPRYVKAAPILADVDRFDARLFGYTPREARCIDPQQRIFLECAWEALEVAAYDPAKTTRPIGVYAGSTISSYLLFGGLQHQLRDDYLFTVIANDKDFLTTRVSYKLDLTGPSVTVQTACSTSLVAVHTACQSLLALECDLALAGGVSVRVPQKAGYLYQDGGILSPDGHCRAFDAAARGTVFGSGAGVVVLKRLADALADGDHIHAVIKGSAVNNDGSTKADFAAPSVIGQSRAIVEAVSRAGIDPETVSYVEAHGTGTPLGDPIEIAALSTAFRAFTRRKGFCAIGSVKTNVGHTDAAAGVIGLIKTVLALEHRLVPPNLHYRRPNPKLDLGNSPFYVNEALAEWAGRDGPRRAGINSLGIGGTNAFVVVEEAPPVPVSEPSWPDQLIRISARTESALDATTARLADHLARHAETELAHVAYTQHMGRRDMAYRRIAVCRDTRAAATVLRKPHDDPAVFTAHTRRTARGVVFLFPGQGAQHPNMGSGMYRSEKVFREQLDRCCEILYPLVSRDLREILHPEPTAAAWAAEELDQTEFTQPVLFALEYALAQLWISWGIRPVACIGHSLGEYVAACLADVFSLEDALSLVAERGRLMQHLPPGSMLALPLSEREVQPYLDAEISLAAVNSPGQVVVSGPTGAIGQLADRVAGVGVRAQLLRASRAFHSTATGLGVDCLSRHVERVARAAPSLPVISGVTGTWMTDAEATDPQYWARQSQQTVRFAEGMQKLLDTTDGALLEVGPGRTLGNLARRCTPPPAERGVLASLPAPGEDRSDRAVMLEAVGRLWLAGIDVDPGGFHGRERRRRVPLPTYPFERERYWIDRAELVHSGGHDGAEETRMPGRPATPSSDGPVDAARPVGAEHAAPDDETDAHPRTPVEGAIATAWCSVLGIDRIGCDDDFFELGGTSLLIPDVLLRVNGMFQVDLPALTLLESPTVAGLARRVEAVYRLAGGLPPPAPSPHAEEPR